jgi:hemerythrin superfamily protein
MPNPVENMAAKPAGKAAGSRTRVRGLTGVFNLLAQQHTEAATLLKRAKQASEPEQRRELWLAVRREIICHERAELTTVYPALHENDDLAGIETAHANDAEQLEAAMSRVDAAGFETSRWPDLLEDLIQLVERHAEQEEKEFFPRIQEAIGKDAADALEAPFRAAREQCLQPLG